MFESAYRREVSLRFQTFNGLLLELPFAGVRDHGILLPVFARRCREGLEAGQRPDRIVEDFFAGRDLGGKSLNSTLYSLLQFAERQIALFDAVEDASYERIHDTSGPQSLPATLKRVVVDELQHELIDFCREYDVRIVLTAHPTQFYPIGVLGIMADLDAAVRRGEIDETYELLLQMGKTRFRNSRKPSPEDEAHGLLWYLENVFYETVPKLQHELDDVTGAQLGENTNIQLGFWPGGDRDGNPFVTPETTLHVAELLRATILNLYLTDLNRMSRRLTFPGVADQVRHIIRDLPEMERYEELLGKLVELHERLESEHEGLFSRYVVDLIRKVATFGFHFATLDLRQDSRVHRALVSELYPDYANIDPSKRFGFLERLIDRDETPADTAADDAAQTLGSLRAAKIVRERNGHRGLHRYVISNTRDAANVLEVLVLARAAGWQTAEFDIDVVPLFETIDDLLTAAAAMDQLYSSPVYRNHLQMRNDHQTIMLGFSDGTKDGGYVAANWQIYRTKQSLTETARSHGIELTFFDGRGGPPSRGGGNTHRFYRSLGPGIAGSGLHVTVQGQTISSKYGTRVAAEHNLGQIVSAGILNRLYPQELQSQGSSDRELLDSLAADGLAAYNQLRAMTAFVPFLERMTPLHFYGQSNIASRPSSRSTGQLTLDSLRAIPFVGAWSQMKLNVPGYYGFGTALSAARDRGRGDDLKRLYHDSLFFRTLVDNAMQSLSKTHFPLTHYLADDPGFGELWETIRREADLTRAMLLEVSGQAELLESEPNLQESIKMREDLTIPVATIQQYALIRLRALRRTGQTSDVSDRAVRELEQIIIKSMAASVNAARNAV